MQTQPRGWVLTYDAKRALLLKTRYAAYDPGGAPCSAGATRSQFPKSAVFAVYLSFTCW